MGRTGFFNQKSSRCSWRHQACLVSREKVDAVSVDDPRLQQKQMRFGIQCDENRIFINQCSVIMSWKREDFLRSWSTTWKKHQHSFKLASIVRHAFTHPTVWSSNHRYWITVALLHRSLWYQGTAWHWSNAPREGFVPCPLTSFNMATLGFAKPSQLWEQLANIRNHQVWETWDTVTHLLASITTAQQLRHLQLKFTEWEALSNAQASYDDLSTKDAQRAEPIACEWHWWIVI